MKYIDAEKLRAEIEKNTPNHLMLMVYRDHILALIDSLQQEQPEEPDKSLEEAAKEYVKDIPTFKDSCLMKAAFEDGWLCSKEQMLKDAVDGEILMQYSGCLCAKTIRAINEDKFKLGDKVRIIIVKEDGK